MKSKGVLNGTVLKWIAIVSMLIDHIAASGAFGISSEVYMVMRGIGRLGFPIFCFLLAQGAWHTKNIKRYVLRIGLFAIISEVPFNLAFNKMWLYPGLDYFKVTLTDRNILDTGMNTNVFFTLLFGLLMLWALRDCKNMTGRSLAIIACTVLAHLFGTDYGAFGVLAVLCMAVASAEGWQRYLGYAMYIVLVLLCYGKTEVISQGVPFRIIYMNNIELLSIAALPVIALYNGERGGERLKMPKLFFYIFYPAHLLILSGIYFMRYK